MRDVGPMPRCACCDDRGPFKVFLDPDIDDGPSDVARWVCAEHIGKGALAVMDETKIHSVVVREMRW